MQVESFVHVNTKTNSIIAHCILTRILRDVVKFHVNKKNIFQTLQ